MNIIRYKDLKAFIHKLNQVADAGNSDFTDAKQLILDIKDEL